MTKTKKKFQEEVAVTFVAGSGMLGGGFSWDEDASAAPAVYVQHENAFDKGSILMRYAGYKLYRCA